MSTNLYFQSGRGIGGFGERELIHSLMAEAIQIHGQDLWYMPRTIANFDELFGEDPTSYFTKYAIIEMYNEKWQGFSGKDDFMSKIGMRTQEEASFRVSKRRFEECVGEIFTRTGVNNSIRPNEGDLLYYPMDNNIFEIRHVSLKDNFYQLDDYYSYILECTLFQYSSERIDTGVAEIQANVPNSLDNLLYNFVNSTENVTIDATANELASVGIGTTPTNQLDYNDSNKTIHTLNATIQDFSVANPFGLSNP